MLIVVDRDGNELEMELELDAPEACVADLVTAVDPVAGAMDVGIEIDGRFHAPDVGIEELPLRDGATVRLSATPPLPEDLPGYDDELAVVAGAAAGRTSPLAGESVTIGRDPGCDVVIDDPTVSVRHVELTRDHDRGGFTVRDLGSSNGTWIDGEPVTRSAHLAPGQLLRLGAVHAVVRRPVNGDELRVGWLDGPTSPFNRPPRPGTPEPPPPLDMPPEPKERKNNRAFSAIALIGPIMMGGMMIAITRNPRFAMFMLMSPVLLIGNHIAGKRRSKKEAATADRDFRKAMVQLREDLETRADEERARRAELEPDLAEVVRRAEAPSTTVWQRRPDHDDYLRVRIGTGDVPWIPPVGGERDVPSPPVQEALDELSTLHRAPVTVDLVDGGVIGVVGNRDSALALARALLCQLTVHQGPADLSLLVTVESGRTADWDWVKWLPHTRDSTGASRMLADDPERSSAMLGAIVSAAEAEDKTRFRSGRETPRGPVHCLVVDDVSLLAGRRAPARLLLGGIAGPVTGIVIAEREDQLPAVCDTVVECWSDLGDAELRRPQERLVVRDLTVAGLDDATARRCARALARFEDPEMTIAGAGLPQLVRLLPLLGLEDLTPDELLARWTRKLPDPPLRTPVGRSEEGVVELDMVTDGPHGLVGGTTGAGKSELLRSLIAGMAASAGPDHLVFVLVDYKGGSAFDECSRLPHTVGMVTDLDDHLGERALKSLEAELHHREHVLRDAGAQDLLEYRRIGTPLGPVPRLVVVIDEFATLATELPDFLGALVGIAQRGRSLGVHMILATQRPRGAVNANIKANTNLRIALRVQDDADSLDIIDKPDAAALSRATPGRALIRLGPGDIELVQTPLSTVGSSGGRTEPLRLRPFTFIPTPSSAGSDEGDEGPSDLSRLVDAANDAFTESGSDAPRRPWLEMLSEDLDLDDLLAREPAEGAEPVRFALADEPDRQRQTVVGWDPAEGHLSLAGMVGSGTTTALTSIACALAATYTTADCHIYALDFGAGELEPLGALPHVGAVIGATEREAQYRLIRTLRRELDRRRDLPSQERARQPRQVILVDGIGGFLAEHEGIEGAELSDAFKRLFTEGPTVKINFVTAGDRPGALPLRLASVVSQRWLFRLAEVNDYGNIGLRAKQVPTFVPGRAVRGEDHRVVQIGRPDSVEAFADRVRQRLGDTSDDVAAPVRIASLPAELPFEAIPGAAVVDRPLQVPLGVTDEDLGPAVLELHPGEHALVTGPPRSGKSSLLRVIAQQLRAADPNLVLVGVCSERSRLFGESTLDAFGTPDRLSGVLAAAATDQRRWVVLVDDAGGIEDESGTFATVVKCGRADLHVIAAGRTDELSSDYGKWTRQVRQSRTGVLLQPNLLTDGNLLSVKLPRRVHVSLGTGRGFLIVGGVAHLAQFALPRERPEEPVADRTQEAG